MQALTKKHIAAFRDSLKRHIDYVYEAGLKLNIPNSRLIQHDQSKWSDEEFYWYARHFNGSRDDPDGFSYAWLHHIHNNAHHWQYWIFPDNCIIENSTLENGIIRMSNVCILEMIADWMAVRRAQYGTWNALQWDRPLGLYGAKIHSESMSFLRTKIAALGYKFVCN